LPAIAGATRGQIKRLFVALTAVRQFQSSPSLAQVCRRIHDISTLPHVALRVMEVANDPDAGPRELKQAMEVDAALSTRVLRCVNSSAYAMRTKITNLQHAIAFLGVKQIRNLALTASVSQLFAKQETIGPYNRKHLWTHLVAVGVCARMAATRLRFPEFEDIFLAGLLHDIGILLEDQHGHAQFVQVIESLQEGQTLCKTECELFGFDHTKLGGQIAAEWKLPQGVIDSIRHHHNSAAYQGEYARTVQCVELANFICSLKGMLSVGVKLVQFPQAAIVALSLTKDDLMVLATDLDAELARNQALMQV
jgi:putative nucleotidyltransferase with HDIG domain